MARVVLYRPSDPLFNSNVWSRVWDLIFLCTRPPYSMWVVVGKKNYDRLKWVKWDNQSLYHSLFWNGLFVQTLIFGVRPMHVCKCVQISFALSFCMCTFYKLPRKKILPLRITSLSYRTLIDFGIKQGLEYWRLQIAVNQSRQMIHGVPFINYWRYSRTLAINAGAAFQALFPSPHFFPHDVFIRMVLTRHILIV